MPERSMPQRDVTDFIAAFAVGAAVGAGLALLLRPAPKTRTERIVRDLQPYGKRLRANARMAKKSFAAGAGAAAEMAETLREASRTLLRDFREEVADVVASAREDLARTVEEQTARAQKALGRGSRRLLRI
jgi:gas vesicle protein